MSYIQSTLILAVLLSIFACHRTPHYPPTMLRAGQPINISPDSALVLLAKQKDGVYNQIETLYMSNEVQMLYNYHHIEKEKNRLILENEKKRILNHQLAIGTVLLLFAGIWIYYSGRKNWTQQLEQERRLRVSQEMCNRASLKQIEKNNEQNLILKKELPVTHGQNDLAKEELLIMKKSTLELKNNRIVLHTEQEVLIEVFHCSSIYLLFLKGAKDSNIKLKESHWEKLQREIDKTYNGFTNRLYVLYPKLSEVELRVCCLVKMSIPASEIAKLVCRKKNTVSSIRERLYTKIHGVRGTTALMDSFIIDF